MWVWIFGSTVSRMRWSKPSLASVVAFKIPQSDPWSQRKRTLRFLLDTQAEHPLSIPWCQIVLETVWVTQSKVDIRTPSNCSDKSNPLSSLFYTKPVIRTLWLWLFMLSTYYDLRCGWWCQYWGHKLKECGPYHLTPSK